MKPVKKNIPESSVVSGNFTRKEASQHILNGAPVVYSAQLGDFTKLLNLVERGIQNNKTPKFPWEIFLFRKTAWLKNSAERKKLIQKVLIDLDLAKKKNLSERVENVLEELLTNAIYHANGYQRGSTVELSMQEIIKVNYGLRSNGVFISVADKGGNLKFTDIQNAFKRCYGMRDVSQIETKEGGAGLGLYLVFENSMHLKIVNEKGKVTRVSCWIPARLEDTKKDFSFGYFEE